MESLYIDVEFYNLQPFFSIIKTHFEVSYSRKVRVFDERNVNLDGYFNRNLLEITL